MAASEAAHGEHHASAGVDNRLLLMWIFLASECLFFGSLISTYLIFKGESLVRPLPDDLFDIPLTSTSTFVLLISSFTMVLAVHGAQHALPKMMKLSLLATILLGLVFLGFQVYEFRTFGQEGLNLSTNQFGASFFVLTGFHGTHVGVGVLYLSSMLFGSMRRNGLGKDVGTHLEIAGLYWHFVDIVWIVIFTVIYLIP
ncbi:MAG: cytochrome oxidase subunit III [Chloroflexi bacterium]|nr:cytochrome c oxidase subunit 3 [Chloroflexota bacterium]MDA1147310.1 cytochrome c oxidase subunit 3 [Chloroflexota bacterium]MQC82479.1 cytochrome oxidase subunit III [Chloroflexota bacterium]MQC83273.1 cytochrome oxidase subunit III [Chloroflexota bacterium]